MKLYSIVEEHLYREELGFYDTYGILAPSGVVCSDVDTELVELTNFVAEINYWGLEEIHLEDAVTDFLSR